MKRGFLLGGAAAPSQAKPAAAKSKKGFDLSNDETVMASDVERGKAEGSVRSGSCGGGIGLVRGQGFCLCTDGMERQPPPTVSEERLPDWSALPELPLGCIAQRLRTLMDFFSFRGVCTSWRDVGRAVEGDVLASHPPLFYGEIPSECFYQPAEKTVCFYHLAEKRVYKKPIGRHNGESPISVAGFSHGHLILWLHRMMWLSNPLTGAENHCFPRSETSFVLALLSSPPTSPGCVLVGHSMYCIQYCRPGGKEWYTVYWPKAGDLLYKVYGVAIVGEKGYVLLDGLGLATFDFTANTALTILNVDYILQPGWGPEYFIFAESKGEVFALLTSDFRLAEEFVVLRFDTLNCKWVRSEDLGGRAVFVDGWKGSIFVDNYAKWGGSKDCVYFFDPHLKLLVEYRVKDGRSESFLFSTENPDIDYFCNIWVLPSLS